MYVHVDILNRNVHFARIPGIVCVWESFIQRMTSNSDDKPSFSF